MWVKGTRGAPPLSRPLSQTLGHGVLGNLSRTVHLNKSTRTVHRPSLSPVPASIPLKSEVCVCLHRERGIMHIGMNSPQLRVPVASGSETRWRSILCLDLQLVSARYVSSGASRSVRPGFYSLDGCGSARSAIGHGRSKAGSERAEREPKARALETPGASLS